MDVKWRRRKRDFPEVFNEGPVLISVVLSIFIAGMVAVWIVADIIDKTTPKPVTQAVESDAN